MPAGTPYNSFVKPYPIRVDEFSVPRVGSLTIAALHLLTHTHSDHIIGLNAKSFGSMVICSGDAKEMLLRHETYQARFLREEEYVIEKQRTFEHLKYTVQSSSEVQSELRKNYDLIRAIPLHVPTKTEISNNEWVTITLIDANHCPGSVMFLIQGSKGAILHTGDFRAEPIFVDSILKNPFLKQYLAPKSSSQCSEPENQDDPETLEAIYLDTASMLNTVTIPSKKEATDGLIDLMKTYPSHMRFFINTWTWGYEDILKAVSCAFKSKIHLDRYKHDVYSSLNDRELRALATPDFRSTRFHACERFSRCDLVRNEDPGVVYINPVNISHENWELYFTKTKAQMERGELPMLLLVPLHRHSTLPELQNFVGLFKPKRLVPNFLEPSLNGLDWACMPNMFGPYMGEEGAVRIKEEMSGNLSLSDIKDVEVGVMIESSELKNLEGGNATHELDKLANIWAAFPGMASGSMSSESMLMRLMGFLPKGISVLVERALRDAAQRKKPLPVYLESDEDEADSSSEEEGSGRMAEFLFGQHLNLTQLEESQAAEVGSQAIATISGTDIKVGNASRPIQLPLTPPTSSPTAHSIHFLHKSVNNSSGNIMKPIDSNSAKTSPDGTTSGEEKRIVPGRTRERSSVRIDPVTEERSSSQEVDVTELVDSPPLTQIVEEETVLMTSTSTSATLLRSKERIAPYDSDPTNSSRKRLKREERHALSRRLSVARPDLASQRAPSQKPLKFRKRRSFSSSTTKAELRAQGTSSSRTQHDSVPGASSCCDPEIDWSRSRTLEKQILEDLRAGRKPSLPSMKFVLAELFPDG